MVADDGVVERALADGGSVESAPPLARGVEGALDLAEHLVCPAIVEPLRPLELGPVITASALARATLRWIGLRNSSARGLFTRGCPGRC